jgi:hypothetical protein
MLVYFVDIWSILWPFGMFCGHLVYFVVIWYSFHILVNCTEKNLANLVFTDVGKCQKQFFEAETFLAGKTAVQSFVNPYMSTNFVKTMYLRM